LSHFNKNVLTQHVQSKVSYKYIKVSKADCECAYVTGGEWRLKYERAIRENDFMKKRLQQEFDDKLEMEQQNKRQFERRVSGHRFRTT